MSLKSAGAGMLGIDHQHGGEQGDAGCGPFREPGANPEFFTGEWRDWIRRQESKGGLQLGGADLGRPAVSHPVERRKRAAEKLPGKDDRIESRTGDAADRTIST